LTEYLIETSAWVAFFRGDRQAVARIDPLLAEGAAAISGPIYAEVLSGAPTRAAVDHLRTLLRSLRWLPDPPAFWERIAEARFHLARQGYQASIADLMIAVTACETGLVLLTRDRDFEHIARVLPLAISLF
jgi:hypothetical protein